MTEDKREYVAVSKHSWGKAGTIEEAVINLVKQSSFTMPEEHDYMEIQLIHVRGFYEFGYFGVNADEIISDNVYKVDVFHLFNLKDALMKVEESAEEVAAELQ